MLSLHFICFIIIIETNNQFDLNFANRDALKRNPLSLESNIQSKRLEHRYHHPWCVGEEKLFLSGDIPLHVLHLSTCCVWFTKINYRCIYSSDGIILIAMHIRLFSHPRSIGDETCLTYEIMCRHRRMKINLLYKKNESIVIHNYDH